MKTLPQPSTAAQPRALLYDRVSTTQQAENGYSSGAEGFQIDLCRAHAERKGYQVVGTRTDVDSGAKWDVEGLLDAMDLAKRGEYDVLVVADSGRFARNLAKKLVYESELRRGGVRVEYTNLPVDNSPEGRLISNMFGAYDEYEREKISWRLTNGRMTKAKRGLYVGNGTIPYGYSAVAEWHPIKKRAVPVGLAAEPNTAHIVRRIYAEARSRSAMDIALTLQAEALPYPVKASRWTDSAVYAILTNPVYKGQATYGRAGRGRAHMQTGTIIAVPALVTPADWDAAQQALAERRIVRRGRQPAECDPFELRGLLRCGHCGGVLAINSAESGRRRYYICLRRSRHIAVKYGWTQCEMPGINAVSIEQHAWDLVTDVLLDAERLSLGLAQIRQLHTEERSAWTQRQEILDEEIAKHERLLRRSVEEKLQVDRDDPRYELYAQNELTEARLVKRLNEERTTLRGASLPGLSDDQAEALETFAAEVRAGVTEATAAERRQVFQLLNVHGVVSHDPERGIRTASNAAPWSARWDAVLPLPVRNSAGIFLKIQALSNAGGLGLVSVSDPTSDAPASA